MIYKREKGTLLSNANMLANVVVCQLNTSILEGDKEQAKKILSLLSADKHISRIKLVTADDNEFVTLILQNNNPAELPDSQRAELSSQKYLFYQDHTYIYVPVTENNQLIGKMYIEINNTPFKKIRKSVDMNLLFFFVRIALIGGFLYWLLERRILKRIETLRNAMLSYFADNQPEHHLPVLSDDEISHLVEGFNEMLDRLSERDKQINATIDKLRVSGKVLDNSHDGVMVLNYSGKITLVNPAVENILGYTSEELLGKNIRRVIELDEFKSVLPTVREMVNRYGRWQGEICEKNKEGQKVPLMVKVHKISAETSETNLDIALFITDLSDIKEKERLDHLAHHDALTGLANRIKLYQTMEKFALEGLSGHAKFAVVYIDLDEFKAINDTYGHEAGDIVLKNTAVRLLSHVRNSDLVARLAGDEFVILVNPAKYDQIKALAQRLLDSLCEDIHYQDSLLSVGASIGVYISSGQDILSTEAMLKCADTAMYQAKSAGKGRYVIDDGGD